MYIFGQLNVLGNSNSSQHTRNKWTFQPPCAPMQLLCHIIYIGSVTYLPLVVEYRPHVPLVSSHSLTLTFYVLHLSLMFPTCTPVRLSPSVTFIGVPYPFVCLHLHLKFSSCPSVPTLYMPFLHVLLFQGAYDVNQTTQVNLLIAFTSRVILPVHPIYGFSIIVKSLTQCTLTIVGSELVMSNASGVVVPKFNYCSWFDSYCGTSGNFITFILLLCCAKSSTVVNNEFQKVV